MRITIDITAAQRARLLALAAHRGEEDLSRIVQEAISQYLEQLADRDGKREGALEVIGSLDGEAADRMLQASRGLRARWR